MVYFLIIVFIAILLAALSATDNFSANDFAKALFPLVATFLGAFLAFRLQEYREELKDQRHKKASINRAILVLGFQHNEIRQYVKSTSTYKDSIDLAINFPALQPPEKYDISQNFDDLYFLLESHSPNILFELIIEQSRFDQAMESIRIRNEFYVQKFQPILAEKQMKNKKMSKLEMEQELGEYLFCSAVNGAKSMSEHIQESDKSLFELLQKLRKLAKEIYPGDKFIEFELLPIESNHHLDKGND